MDNHKQAFIEEATELLALLESALLELEDRPDDSELIAKVFRALHTIKGSGGMFGFDDIAIFTHDIETVYDFVRNGKIQVTKELIDLTLSARDQICNMLRQSEGQNNVSEAKTGELMSAFRNIVFIYNSATDSSASQAKAKPSAGTRNTSGKTTFRIQFTPARETFLFGTNPVLLLNELRELGECRVVHHQDRIPGFEELNPEECFSYWEIFLTTDKDEDAIRDVFIFVEDSCELKIEVSDVQDKNITVVNNKTQEKQGDHQENKKSRKEERNAESDPVSSIRVSADKLDLLVNLVGEMVTVQARLTQTAQKRNDPDLVSIAEEVERLTWELRDSALNIRMLPIGTTFNKFKRLVRDLSQELGKEVELVTDGAETELDKNVIERLNDPLVHIIRNCMDHGIEMPEVRENQGKSKTGRVHLSASQAGGSVLIKIHDDGKGLDKERILAKAVSNGLVAADAELKESEIFSLIFAPGFSTAEKVTNVSGRGVGMDVVKQAIDSLRGSIEIDSRKDEGTTITLRLPLTLAIIDGLLVQIDDEFFIMPLSAVEECIELTDANIESANGRNLVSIRGEIVPYIRLRESFGIPGKRPGIEQVVISNVNGSRIGFAVDNVIGSHQTVLKNLGRVFRSVSEISGATILGDGRVAMILDMLKIVREEERLEKLRTSMSV